jgi:uncharacterized iron-regulated membrane protein
VAQSTTMRLRALWLKVHKWIGILLAVLIIPISLTGSALVWHDWLDEQINPQRYDVAGKTGNPMWRAHRLPGQPSLYEYSARQALGADALIVSIRYPEGIGPVVVTALDSNARAQSGPPPRVNVWLDPYRLFRIPIGSPDHSRVAVLDTAPANAGLVRVFHNLHGNLLVSGGSGRAIVGWVGAFMCLSCLTGIWLWWPIGGSFRRGFRWKRQHSTNANIHHQVGFWVLVPLAMLSFTGVWISAPAMVGAQPPRPAPPRVLERPALTPDAALAAARPAVVGGGQLVSVTWPTDQGREWKIAFAREGGPAEVSVNDTNGAVTPPRPPRPETTARLMRRLHDGTGMGLFWQIIIFIGGIIPAILAVTGLVMWWRSRGWKAALAKKRKARAAVQPAE